MLICGGGSVFNVQDLKNNHRVVGDLLDHAGLSDTDLPRYNFSETEQRKILRWFWITVSNLSYDEQTRLLSLVTGSKALPTCGFRHLSPLFTISLTGGYDQAPKFHPTLHLVTIGNHSSYSKFEKNIIESLYDEDEMGINQADERNRTRRTSSDSSMETEAQNEADGMPLSQRIVRSCAIV